MTMGRTTRTRAGRVIALVGLLGSVIVADVTPAHAAFPGINGKIACASNRTGNFEIFTFDPNGTELNPVNLTNNPASDSRPRWRSDGRKIVFESNRESPSDLYVMDADGSNVQRITFTGDASNGAWHPDGSQILYQRSFGNLNFDIYKVNIDGTNPTPVSPTPFEDSLGFWDPEGTTIAFSSRRAEGNSVGPDVYTMDSFGNNVVNLTKLPGVEDSWPNWSPDGSQIAFHSRRDDPAGEEIYKMNRDGSNVVQLTHYPNAFDIFPAWSPDGSRIVFNSDRQGSGFGEVWHMSATAGDAELVRVTSNPATDQRCDWQPLCTIYGSGVIVGTPGNDIICGSEGPDRIVGNGGNDIVYGFGGDDQISLGGGNDRAFGGLGDDTIDGGGGLDFLSGGPGSDRLSADTGSRMDPGSGRNVCSIGTVGTCPPRLS